MADKIVVVAKDPVKESLITAKADLSKRPPISSVNSLAELRLRVAQLENALEDILNYMGLN